MLFFIVRRSLCALITIFMWNSIPFQIQLYQILSLLQIAYLLGYKPYAESHVKRQELMNESICLLVAYCFLALGRMSLQGIYFENGEMQVGDIEMEATIG